MSNFGFNVLGLAQTVIGKQAYQIEEWASSSRNNSGFIIDVYSDPVTRHAGIQPISTEKMNLMGLQMNAVYRTVFDLGLIKILDRAAKPPRITYNGYYWNVVSPSQDWLDAGGWNQVTIQRGDKVA